MPIETTDFRAIAAEHAAGRLTDTQASELHAARKAYVLKKVADGFEFQAWLKNRKHGLAA